MTTSVPADAQPDVPLAEQLGVLEDLRAEGKVELIGMSNALDAEDMAALEAVEQAGLPA